MMEPTLSAVGVKTKARENALKIRRLTLFSYDMPLVNSVDKFKNAITIIIKTVDK